MAGMTNDLITRLILQTKEFDSNLQRSQKEMRNFQKDISSQVGSVQKGFSSAIGVVGKLAPALGIAVGGVETFKKVISSTQSTQDAFNRVVEQAKTGIDMFFESIARGDMSNFNNGLHDAIRLAGEFYDVLDELQTRQIHSTFELKQISVEESNVRKEIAETRLKLAQATTDAERKIQTDALKALEGQLTAFNDDKLNVQQDLYNKSYNAFSASLRKEFRMAELNQNQVLEYIKTNNQDALNSDFETYKQRLAISKKFVGAGIAWQRKEQESARKEGRMTNTEAMDWLKSEEAARMRIAYLIKESKDDLQEPLKYLNQANDLMISMNQSATQTADAERKLLNATKETGTTTTSTVSNTIAKQKELFTSYDTLIAKADEFRNKLNEAKETGDVAGIQFYMNEITKLNIQIKALERIISMQNPKQLETPSLKLPVATFDPSSVNAEMQAVVEANKAIARSNYERAIAAADAANIQREATLGLIESLGFMIDMNDLSAASFIRMVAKILPQIATLVGAKGTQTIAETTSSGASAGGIPGAIAGLSVGLGLVASILSASTKPKFAGGGIVGDQNIIRVNQGEMILNNAQQNRLFNTINSGSTNNQTSPVEFVIRGQDLVGIQKNYNSKFNR